MTGNTGILPYPPIDATGASLPPSRIAQGGATTGQVLKWTGAAWAPADGQGSGFAPGDIFWSGYTANVNVLPATSTSGSGAAAGYLAGFTSVPFAGGMRLQTGTTTTGHAVVCVVSNNDSVANVLFPQTGYRLFCEAGLWLPTLFTSAEDFRTALTFGAGDNTLTFGRGAQLYADHATGTWRLRTQNASSSSSEADTGVSVAAQSLVRVRMMIDGPAGPVHASIDGSKPTTVSTNFDGSGRARFVMGLRKIAGTTNRELLVNYFWVGYRPL